MKNGNSEKKVNKTSRTIGRLPQLLLTIGLFMSLSVSGQGIKPNDQSLIIKTDTRGCAIEVELDSAEDNCSGSDFANNCGKKGKDCVCMRTGKFVSWRADNSSRFEIKFTGADPFTNNCDLKSKNKPRIKCKVAAGDGDYMYDVVLESCPDQTYDPMIIIRN